MNEIEKRDLIQAEARKWIGTPFRHQARVKEAGVDCANLIIAVGNATGFMDVDATAWMEFDRYGRAPNPRHMRKALEMFMVEIDIEQAKPGDVYWMQWSKGLPMHVAFRAEQRGLKTGQRRATMIHAYSRVGRVVEHGFSGEWPSRVVSAWRMPGLVENE